MKLTKTIEHLHIRWYGPYRMEDIQKLNGDTDHGLYCVCGAHPMYGPKVVLNIGKAQDQTFAVRIPQKGLCAHANEEKLEFWVGRLCELEEPDAATWDQYITWAELLLIKANLPALNSQLDCSAEMDEELGCIHVHNQYPPYGLLKEASGATHADFFDKDPHNYSPVGTENPNGPQ